MVCVGIRHEAPPELAALVSRFYWSGVARLGRMIRYVRAFMVEALSADYYVLARAKGLSRDKAAFRHALGSFLSLTVTALAGGAGVDQALDDAASVGRGPAYAELRYALAEAVDFKLLDNGSRLPGDGRAASLSH